jgi:UDP-N-acetyl-D-glucosamine dehydrogenase
VPCAFNEMHEVNAHDQLKSRIDRGEAVVGVVGLGYVGLPLAAAFHDAPGAVRRVIGFDNDPKKIETLARGGTYLKHLGEALTKRLASSGRFEATGDPARLCECDAVMVCVPTPLNERHEPDLSYVLRTAEAIGRSLRAGMLIVLESTTYPGTTRDEFAPAIARAATHAPGLRIGEEWFVAFSPERENPGDSTHTTRSIPKLVGGLDDRSAGLASALYRRAIREVIVVGSAEIAESAKLLENIFRAVNIALVNEMKMTLGAMGIDIWEVVRAASTKPFGFMPFFPGPGMGGHCIPVDPFYLAWKARQAGQPARFIELAGEVNVRMPRYVVERTAEALAERGVAIDKAKVLVLGLAYKPDIDDVRESPSFELIALLREAGASVEYSDPHVPATWAGRRHDLGMKSVGLTAQSLSSYDAVVIATNHRAFNYALVARHAGLVIDTRDAMRAFEKEMGERLVRA